MRTLGDRFTAGDCGFSEVRIVLAFGILSFHAITTTNGSAEAIQAPIMACARLILPMFFAMSGFLVAASLSRSRSILEFLLLRLLRLMPAFAVVVLLTALALGPAVSSFAAGDYFHDPALLGYLHNLAMDTNYILPGVFTHNPRAMVVNGSLWTIPLEIVCYAGLSALAVLGVLRHALLFALLVGALGAAFYIAPVIGLPNLLSWLPAPGLTIFFFSGAALYHLSGRIAHRPALAVLALGISLATVPDPSLCCLGAFPLAYFTIWLSTFRIPRSRSRGDYSYGLYLLGYPVEQTYLWLSPGIRLWWVTLAASFPIALLFAVLLWHFVERPVLCRKAYIIDRILSTIHSLKCGSFAALSKPARQQREF